ncbi:MAG: DUF3349 domain-containing protein [Dermatophilaceae bacterium]
MWRVAQRFTSGGRHGRATPTASIPLVALLGRRLSDQEVLDISARLADLARANPTALAEVDLAIEITRITDALPTTLDIDRVREAMAHRGVPVRRRAPQPS